MNATNHTHLLLLSIDPTGPAIHLQVDGSDRVLARNTVSDAAPAAIIPTQPPARQVLAVPGIDCLALWLELPARNPVQALAAARLLIEDHVAGTRGALHVAIASLPPNQDKRLVVAVESALMQGWIDRAAALGMTPDTVVPAPLLLPMPGTDGAVIVASHDGHWLVRGEHVAFASEPALAEQILGGQSRQPLSDVEDAFAAGAGSPPINLLQYQFGLSHSRRDGWPAYRRATMLAALLALSPLLLLGAQTLRYQLGARSLESQAEVQARAALPALAENVDPLPAIRARVAELAATDGWVRSAGALLNAIQASDATELDALAYADGELRATVVHDNAADLDHIRAAVAGAGLELVETGTRTASGRIHSSVVVRPAA